MMIHKNVVLQNNIKKEQAGTDYVCSQADRVILTEMLSEINCRLGTDIHYLAEVDAYSLSGAGDIIASYIHKFESQSVRGYLLPQLILDRLPDCDKTILQLYLSFKNSDVYISKPGMPAPTHIYTRYDNVIKKMKPKRLHRQLVDLICNPRDAFYLPFTMRMVASWKSTDIYKVLQRYAQGSSFTAQDVGLPENVKNYYPSVDAMDRGIRFSAIVGLGYYPSVETMEILAQCVRDSNDDISKAAQKVLKQLQGIKG